MKTKRNKNSAARVVASDRMPKAIAGGALTISLLAGADNVLAVGLTAATLGAAEAARSRFSVRSLRPSVSSTANSQLKPVAGHTP